MKNISKNDDSVVSPFHSLGDETVKQDGSVRNIARNNTETTSLKTLATKVLERNKSRNKPETQTENFVSLQVVDETRSADKFTITDSSLNEYDKYIELFEERAAIMEFDGGLHRMEAEHYAYLEVLDGFISENYHDIKAQFSNIINKQK